MSDEAARHGRTRRSVVGPGLILLVVALALIPAPLTSALAGEAPYDDLFLSYPGAAVSVATGLAQATADLASTLTLGAIVGALFFRDASGPHRVRLGRLFELRVVQAASATWALAAAAMVVLEMSDSSGASLESLAVPGGLEFLYVSSAFPRAWTVAFLAAALTFVLSVYATRWTGLLVPLWASVVGALAPVVVGQVLVGPDHDFGSDAAIFQTVLAGPLFGLVLVCGLRLAWGRAVPAVTRRRILATCAFVLPFLVGSEVLLGWFRLAGTGLWESTTGGQVLARGAALALLCCLAFVAWLRGRRGGKGVAPLLAGLAALGVGGWLGVSAAMTRVPPPSYFQPTTIAEVFLGFDIGPAPTIDVLVTQWRPNVFFLVLGVTAIVFYLVAVRGVRRRGDHWPVGRTLCWVIGWTLIILATSSGFGRYSAVDLGIHMVVHMTLSMLAPSFLVMGGILTLMLRWAPAGRHGAAGLHDWITWALQWGPLRLAYHPLVVFVVFIGSYYALYFSGAFGDLMRFHWGHQLMNLHFLVTGYLYYSLAVGVDRPPRPLPHIGKLGYLMAAMPFHAFFGIALMTSGTLIAENFYRTLDLPWANLPEAQYFAGGVAWAGSEGPLLVVIIALVIQWSRQDDREARRKDRHLDTGRDDEFEAYNRMLERLSARPQGSGPGGPRRPVPSAPAPRDEGET